MVVNYLDSGGACIGPHEADAVSFVDANTVLPPSISGQPFETVARGYSKIAQCGGGIELVQLALSHSPNRHGACPQRHLSGSPVEDILSTAVLE